MAPPKGKKQTAKEPKPRPGFKMKSVARNKGNKKKGQKDLLEQLSKEVAYLRKKVIGKVTENEFSDFAISEEDEPPTRIENEAEDNAANGMWNGGGTKA
ncbi:hypothetical protein COLO4_30149 [Corchorus olitorius]|uniref:Uncharacterized protein n=1 Tax=Corchorus olitorius TaxID=93759 RepID=A0A1R3HAR3_9ROSI|nr:hypothetical protein COLO4_30149 [Corchorus olitorius]